MKKGLLLACIGLLLAVFAVPAAAAGSVSSGNLQATVSADGSCQVTLDLQLHLDGTGEDLVFPLPGAARSITVNGSSARTSRTGDVTKVRLSLGAVAGDFTLRIQYVLPEAVTCAEEGKCLLTLPMLSGFDYSLGRLDFSVFLPGEVTARPDFVSGYYHQTIETSIDYEYRDGALRGTVNTELKDRETLTMTLAVPGELFPTVKNTQWKVGWTEYGLGLLSLLALVYWLAALRSAPFLAPRTPQPPEGCTAGELSGFFTDMGGNLTMMVFSWAELGYILIQVTDTGRVILHKRMEMGNERDAGEVRLFKALFGKRRYIDGTGYQYAQLRRRAAAERPNVRFLYQKSSGNPRFLRILCLLAGVLSGISLGRAILADSLLALPVIGILGLLAGGLSRVMQDWVKGLHLRGRRYRLFGLAAAALWLLLGALAGIPWVTGLTALLQLLCGLAVTYGGRRTPTGRQTVSQILGLRRYLKRLSPKDAHLLTQRYPNYFFSMLPYALALGVEKPFAKSFRGKRFPPCAWLTDGSYRRMTALEWARLLDGTAEALDQQYHRLFLDRLLGK